MSHRQIIHALGVVGLLVTLTVRPAFGHALYVRSEPASGAQFVPPGQIQVWFTESVEPDFSKIEVLDSTRRRVDLDDTHAVPGDARSLIVSVGQIPDGTYTVSWKALSAVDGHVTQGLFPLVVGEGGLSIQLEEAPAYVPSVRDVVARWAGYVAALALAGGFIFRLLVFRPALATLRSDERRAVDLRQGYSSRFRRVGLVACTILLLASLLGMVSQAANAADVSLREALGAPLLRLLGTRLGVLWEVRFGLSLVLVLLVCSARGRLLWWGGLLASVAVLLVISLNSHAAAIQDGAWLAVTLDWLHQVAAAAWVGGLFSFAVLVPTVTSALQPPQRLSILATVVPRFSALAILSVVVLALTGTFQAWLQVKSLQALPTLYGGSLVLKLLLLVPLLGLGAANLLIAKPRLARLAVTHGRNVATALDGLDRRLRRIVVIEALLGVAVLLVTAVLTASEPARETYARRSQPIEFSGRADDIGVTLRIAPGRPGANLAEVRLADAAGRPVPDIQRVTLRFTYLDQELGSGTLVLQPREDGSYGAVASNLSTEGNWQIEAVVRQRGRDDVRVGFRTPVSSPETAGRPPSLGALPFGTSTPRHLISMGLAATGLALTFWISRTGGVRRRERLALYAASFAVAMIGGVLYARASTTPRLPMDIQALRNPFPPDTASLSQGRAIYEQQCVTCHGPSGRGDGPLAASLRPRPADFRVHMAAGHTDGELFTWLSKGVPGTAMPPFEAQIPESDRWHVINYIRGFAPQID